MYTRLNAMQTLSPSLAKKPLCQRGPRNLHAVAGGVFHIEG